MNDSISTNKNEPFHTDDIDDIITKVPPWILRWGITVFAAVLILVVGLANVIEYPDVINAPLTIGSTNSAKPVMTKVQGKLIKLLVKNGDNVVVDEPLGYIESTADHLQIIDLSLQLRRLKKLVQSNGLTEMAFFDEGRDFRFGELQIAYQTFYQEYLSYKSAAQNGFFLKKRSYLTSDLIDLKKQEAQLINQKILQQRDLKLSEEEYNIHRKLAQEKVETSAELRREESKYIAKRALLTQTESSLAAADMNYIGKQKEVMELDNLIQEQRAKFIQSINSLISQVDEWKSKYILTAAQQGELTFADNIQENSSIQSNSQIFLINPKNNHFFGEMSIQQIGLGKVKKGQRVLIKLKSYPFEEYGILEGRITHISDVLYNDTAFNSRVEFSVNPKLRLYQSIHLKQGMTGEAQIVTENATLFSRIIRSLVRLINHE